MDLEEKITDLAIALLLTFWKFKETAEKLQDRFCLKQIKKGEKKRKF